MTPIEFSTFEVIIFLLIDFVILASVVAGIFFLVLFLKTRKQKHIKVVNLNDLEAFKNRNLQMETDISIQQNRPVAPSTIQQNNEYIDIEQVSYSPPPMRTASESNQKMFNCQMQQNEQQMNDTFVATQGNNTNYFNM